MVLAEITTLIALFKGIRSTYDWGREVLSIEWKNEYRKFVDYLEEVERAVTSYNNSKCSKTLIEGALKLLEGELKEAWSFVHEWRNKIGPRKQLTSDAFIKQLQTSRATIAQDLVLFWIQLSLTEQEGNHAEPQTRLKVKEFEKQEKEREVTEYRAWLSENITKWTDSWTTYKTDSERATNSKLDLAEKERLFRKHVDELREQYLRDYRQLLTEVITPDLASKYLTSWSDAKNRMLQRQRFLNLPERERETEWRNHAEQILKQRQIAKEREVTEYRDWLRKNITKWTDSWTTYKTDSERATNSKLDLAEKERLFRKHVDELREQYLRDYRQLLKEVITPDLASKYLTSWSDAKSRMLQRQRFLNLPERERETEWRSHAEQHKCFVTSIVC